MAQYMLGRLYQMGWVNKDPDYPEARKWYTLAQKNYAPAAVALGFLYDTVTDDYANARMGYELAASKGDPVGLFNLGLMYEQGKGMPENLEKAKSLYSKAAEAGHAQSMVQLAGLYLNAKEDRDEDEALIWYKKAAALGDRDALYQLGFFFETGVAGDSNPSEALQYYRQAADKGNEKAVSALARLGQARKTQHD
jgi:enhanced entry protein EnhC